MASKEKNIKKDDDSPRKSEVPKENPNSDEQVQLLLHLLLRAKNKKLDILGVVWEDTDLGKCSYSDYYDLPKSELTDMLKHVTKVLELS